MLKALIDGDAAAQGKDQNRHHKTPEINLLAVAKGKAVIGRLFRLFDAVQQQYLIAGINKRVNAFRQHGGTAGDEGSDKLGNGNEAVAKQGGDDDHFG